MRMATRATARLWSLAQHKHSINTAQLQRKYTMNTEHTAINGASTSKFSTEYISPTTCKWVNSDVRILVVDDERLMRDLMALSLRRLGFAVEAVADGRTALTLLENEYFDLVMLDVVMPDIDGFTMLSE